MPRASPTCAASARSLHQGMARRRRPTCAAQAAFTSRNGACAPESWDPDGAASPNPVKSLRAFCSSVASVATPSSSPARPRRPRWFLIPPDSQHVIKRAATGAIRTDSFFVAEWRLGSKSKKSRTLIANRRCTASSASARAFGKISPVMQARYGAVFLLASLTQSP
jgi:hypothetical protein